MKDDVRQSLYDACNEWTKAISKKERTFLGGKDPNLADLVKIFYYMNVCRLSKKFSQQLFYQNNNNHRRSEI